jgi:hypothetical protein
MKIQFIPILTSITSLVAAATSDADVALSPRAAANQITTVCCNKGDLDLARVQLGEAARAKSSGDYSVVISGGVKDADLTRGVNALGLAAKSKASGSSIPSGGVQIAPLK